MAAVVPVTLRFVTEEWSREVPSPPHDSLSANARRAHLEKHPRSYLGVTRTPEDGSGSGATDALQLGRATLVDLLTEGVFGPPTGPTFYIYRLEDGDHCQAGLICGVSTEDYDSGTVRIHERINQGRADHLAEHLRVVGAQSSPIALAFRSKPSVTDLMATTMDSRDPLLDILDDAGLRQQLWEVDSTAVPAASADLAETPLYLIDGHHRAAAASTNLRRGEAGDHQMLSVLFPFDELRNQAFHRIVSNTPGSEIEAALSEHFPTRQTDDPEVVADRAKTEMALAVPTGPDGPDQLLRWTLFDVLFDSDSETALDNIDPIRLSNHVLGPVLGIDESNSDPRLSYRPGLADRETLAHLELGADEVLFLMRPVSMTTLMETSDAGLVMPPKSTYFQPKVRSGLFIRIIDDALTELT